MGKIITIIGNVGVGKTSAARRAAEVLGAIYCGESHDDRPFQHLAKTEPRYTFHNQVNYLLARAEQEEQARSQNRPTIFDGGLDMDLYIFTRLFYENGKLNEEEYKELIRLGSFFRRHLPHPDQVVFLRADPRIIEQRFLSRDRVNLAAIQDLERIDKMLHEYINTIPTNIVLYYDTTTEGENYADFIKILGKQL